MMLNICGLMSKLSLVNKKIDSKKTLEGWSEKHERLDQSVGERGREIRQTYNMNRNLNIIKDHTVIWEQVDLCKKRIHKKVILQIKVLK